MGDKDVKYIYAHNFSGFDGIFLLRHLLNYDGGEIKPLIKEGKIYNIKLSFYNKVGNTNYVIYIRDSLLILPQSLYKLGLYFKVNTLKTVFPIHSLNDLSLNYKGSIPDKKYFKNESEYQDYISNHKGIWNLKKELI